MKNVLKMYTAASECVYERLCGEKLKSRKKSQGFVRLLSSSENSFAIFASDEVKNVFKCK